MKSKFNCAIRLNVRESEDVQILLFKKSFERRAPVDATMLDVSKAKLPEMKVIFELEISEENCKFQVDNLLVKKIGQDQKYHQFISGLSASGPSDVLACNKRTRKLLRYADAWLDIDEKRFHDEYNRIIDFNPKTNV